MLRKGRTELYIYIYRLYKITRLLSVEEGGGFLSLRIETAVLPGAILSRAEFKICVRLEKTDPNLMSSNAAASHWLSICSLLFICFTCVLDNKCNVYYVK